MTTIFYESDFTLLETIEDIDGNEIDPRTINFVISYYTDGQNKYQASHKNGKYVNCEYDADSGKLIVIFAKHGLRPGILKHKLMVMSDDSLFPLGIRNDKSLADTDITLSLTGGDSYTADATMMVPALQITHSATLKDDIIDADEVNYLDSENNFSLVKTTWLNIKAKLKTYFDTLYEPKKSTGENYVSDEELEVLQNTSGENTGDETAESIIDKIGTDGQIKSDYLPSYVDDVIEGYLLLGVFYEDAAHTIPITGKTGKIYIDIENSNNDEYRWTGTVYANITNPLDYASKSDAETGTDTTKVMPAVRVKDSILYQLSNGVISTLNTVAKNVIGAVNELLAKIVTTWTATTLDTNIPSEKLVKDSLNLKADITPANGATSALRALFVARGATYNGDGTYTLGGIPNLTELDVMNSYNYTSQLINNQILSSAFSGAPIRTNFPPIADSRDLGAGNYSSAFSKCLMLESVVGAFINISNWNYAFYLDAALHTIDYLDITNLTLSSGLSGTFQGCSALVTCKLKGVKVAFSLAWSPLLSLASLQYLVTNRANGTSRITITVHATVWGYLNDAVGHPTWNALLVDAVNNQYIDFASA